MPARTHTLLSLCLGLLLPAACLLGTAACHTSYGVENRETPVHVWLTAPGLAAEGGTIDALIYVGSQKVADGPIRFPAGTPTIDLATAYLRTGDTRVSAVIQRTSGPRAAREEIEIEGESWIQVLVSGAGVQIVFSETQPSPVGR